MTFGSRHQGCVDRIEVMSRRKASRDVPMKPTEDAYVVSPGIYRYRDQPGAEQDSLPTLPYSPHLDENRLCVGLIANVPQKAAGIRTEPAVAHVS